MITEAVPATFDVSGQQNSIIGNVAAGGSRVGFRVQAVDACVLETPDMGSDTQLFRENVAHSNLIGLHVIAEEAHCVEVTSFVAYR